MSLFPAYEKKQLRTRNRNFPFSAPHRAKVVSMSNLANLVSCLNSLRLLSVLFLFVSCILCFGSVGGVLSEFLSSVAREQIGFLKSFCSVSCPLWVSHGLLSVIFVVCVPSFVFRFKPSNYAIYFHYICHSLFFNLMPVSGWHGFCGSYLFSFSFRKQKKHLELKRGLF